MTVYIEELIYHSKQREKIFSFENMVSFKRFLASLFCFKSKKSKKRRSLESIYIIQEEHILSYDEPVFIVYDEPIYRNYDFNYEMHYQSSNESLYFD